MKNRIMILVSIVLIALYPGGTMAQPDIEKIEALCYDAYLQANLGLWQQGIDDYQALASVRSDDHQLFYQLSLAQLGLLNATMATRDEDTFDEFVDETKSNLDQMLEIKPDWSEAHSIYAAVYGLEMGYSPIKGIFLGSRSDNHIKDALKSDSLSPLAWKTRASSKLFTPAMFGGNVEEAITNYQKSVDFFESRKETDRNWLYLDALAWLGLAYEKTKEYQRAKETYLKALSIEPQFPWVQEILLPNVEKKISYD